MMGAGASSCSTTGGGASSVLPTLQLQSFLKTFVAPVNAHGKGVVQIKFLGGQEIGPPRKMAKMLNRGQFGLLGSPTAYYLGLVPEGRALLGANQGPHALRKNGVDPVLLASPTTVPARLAWLADQTRGFLYYVSLTGVTGARARLGQDIEAQVRRVKEHSDIPVCVGFGVSKPEHAASIASYADGVVVGSALVDRIEATTSPEDAVDAAARFVAELKAPLRGGG